MIEAEVSEGIEKRMLQGRKGEACSRRSRKQRRRSVRNSLISVLILGSSPSVGKTKSPVSPLNGFISRLQISLQRSGNTSKKKAIQPNSEDSSEEVKGALEEAARRINRVAERLEEKK